MNILLLKETDSTNQYMQNLLHEHPDLPDSYVVRTEFQSAGKGQLGNTWESERASNLLFSILLRPQSLEAKDQFILSRYVALSMISMLHKFLDGKEIKIKWPNDIYVGDKKIAGILIENATQGKHIVTSVVGIGLNVNQTHFVSDAPNPTSMALLSSKTFDCTALLNAFLQELNLWRQKDHVEIEKSYMQYLYRTEGYYPYEADEGRFFAKIVDVLHNGHLLLQREDNTLHEYALKEVRFIL